MDPSEKDLRTQYANHTTAKLREIRACRKATSTEAAVLDQILHERDFWQRFWTSGIVAWISLVVSIIALIASLVRSRG